MDAHGGMSRLAGEVREQDAAIPASRTATIRAKRPDSLMKMPSTSYMTERTVTPGEGPDLGDIEADDTSYAFPTGAAQHSHQSSEATATASNAPPQSTSSPDSWRSLLPDNDPYFVSAEDASKAARRESVSSALSSNHSFASRRFSSESQQSSFSLPPPEDASTSSRMHRPSIHDIYSGNYAGGSRAAFSPQAYPHNLSTPSLDSPGPSAKSYSTDDGWEQRRHASFSTFDDKPVKHANALKVHARSRLVGGVERNSSPGASSALSNDEDRESWPSSRNSMQDLPASAVAAKVDTKSIDQALAKEFQSRLQTGVGTDGASPIIAEPNSVTTSTVESVQSEDGGRLLTTRMTTTTTTTTTFVQRADVGVPPPPPPMSPPNVATNGLPYEVTTLPTSSLPFLESRPAPPSTDLGIETHASHYIVKSKLPGFSLDGITLATKHHRQLVIVADKWDDANGGHFERRINFGPDADLRNTRAKFDGSLLQITVPRRTATRNGPADVIASVATVPPTLPASTLAAAASPVVPMP